MDPRTRRPTFGLEMRIETLLELRQVIDNAIADAERRGSTQPLPPALVDVEHGALEVGPHLRCRTCELLFDVERAREGPCPAINCAGLLVLEGGELHPAPTSPAPSIAGDVASSRDRRR